MSNSRDVGFWEWVSDVDSVSVQDLLNAEFSCHSSPLWVASLPIYHVSMLESNNIRAPTNHPMVIFNQRLHTQSWLHPQAEKFFTFCLNRRPMNCSSIV